MIRAKFIKAVPTEEGITYTLKGETDKVALHSAVDMQGEECVICLPTIDQTPVTEDLITRARFALLQDWLRQDYERGLADAVQGNLLEEKGE